MTAVVTADNGKGTLEIYHGDKVLKRIQVDQATRSTRSSGLNRPVWLRLATGLGSASLSSRIERTVVPKH